MTFLSKNPCAREPECLITGATLWLVNEQLCKPADLFLLNGNFILNAAGEGVNRLPTGLEYAVCFDDSGDCFSRRNVYVLPADLSVLSPAAHAYIERTRA